MPELLPLNEMTDTAFEEFCFELMREVGFVNLDWRKGTGKESSPSDSGRDIVAHWPREDIDGSTHLETWFVDCKHYRRGVPPDKVQSLLSWAQAERPHVALIIASNFLSNPCKDYLVAYERNNRPPFRVRWWERPTIERMVEGKDEFLRRLFQSETRAQTDILEAEQDLFDRVWYDRHQLSYARSGKEWPENLQQQALAAARKIEERVGKENLGPYTDYDWGMINGKLSALRWVLGDEWDFLDT